MRNASWLFPASILIGYWGHWKLLQYVVFEVRGADHDFPIALFLHSVLILAGMVKLANGYLLSSKIWRWRVLAALTLTLIVFGTYFIMPYGTTYQPPEGLP